MKKTTTKAAKPATGSINAEFNTAALRKAVAAADTARHLEVGGGRIAIPILQRVVLDATRDGGTVAYHGIDLATSIDVPAKGKGMVAVPVRPLRSFLGAVTDDTVRVIKEGADARVRFVSTGLSLTLADFSPSDCPDFVEGKEAGASFVLPEGVLANLFALTLPFVSREETRYYLNGVMLRVIDGKVEAVATDGHRLGHRQHTLATACADLTPSIIPRNTCDLLAKLVGNDEVDLSFHANRVAINFGQTRILSKLIDGTFPTFEKVVPEIGPHKVALKRKDVLPYLKAGQGIRRERGSAVRILATDKAAQFTIIGPDHDAKFEGVYPAEVEGSPKVFGFNSSYLVAMFRLFGPELVINVSDASNSPGAYTNSEQVAGPVRITSPNSPEGDYAVLMPMRV